MEFLLWCSGLGVWLQRHAIDLSPAQWVKESGDAVAAAWLAAGAQIWSLAWDLPYAAGMAIKWKKKNYAYQHVFQRFVDGMSNRDTIFSVKYGASYRKNQRLKLRAGIIWRCFNSILVSGVGWLEFADMRTCPTLVALAGILLSRQQKTII